MTDDEVWKAGMRDALAKLRKNKDHKWCPSVLKKGMAGGGIEVTVAALRPLVRGPYYQPPYICPHGVRYWIEPTGEQIARWVADGIP